VALSACGGQQQLRQPRGVVDVGVFRLFICTAFQFSGHRLSSFAADVAVSLCSSDGKSPGAGHRSGLTACTPHCSLHITHHVSRCVLYSFGTRSTPCSSFPPLPYFNELVAGRWRLPTLDRIWTGDKVPGIGVAERVASRRCTSASSAVASKSVCNSRCYAAARTSSRGNPEAVGTPSATLQGAYTSDVNTFCLAISRPSHWSRVVCVSRAES
jgi:hypothetical protein